MKNDRTIFIGNNQIELSDNISFEYIITQIGESISISSSNTSLNEIYLKLLNNTELSYCVENKNIIVMSYNKNNITYSKNCDSEFLSIIVPRDSEV